MLRSNPCACWRKRWPTCGATVRFYRLGDDCLRPSKAEALFLGLLARGAPVASGPCHDRPNHVARFAAQRQIGNFGMISQIAVKPELSKAAHLGSYWFSSGSIRFEAVDNRVFRIICQCLHDWRSFLKFSQQGSKARNFGGHAHARARAFRV